MPNSHVADEYILYPTRASQLPIIKSKHKDAFKTLVGKSDTSCVEEENLSYKEFVIISYILHFNVNNIIQMSDLSYQYGAGYIVVSFVFLELTLGMPLLMLCCFLGNYSRKSFITFWSCVPLFEGLGYTMLIAQFVMQPYNVLISSLSLLFFTDLVHYEKRRKILNCELSKYDALCFTPMSNRSYDCAKSPPLRERNESIYTALQYHLRFHVMGYDEFSSECCTINMKLLATMICLWIVIFMISMLGLTRIKKASLNIIIVTAILLFLVGSYSVSLVKVEDVSSAYGTYGNQTKLPLLRFHFWVDMVFHAGGTNSIPTTLWLSSFKGDGYTPEQAFLTITFFKIAGCIILFCFGGRILHSIVNTYNIKYLNCLRTSGSDLVLAFIPETFLRGQFGGMAALLWYFAVFYLSLLASVYSITGFVGTIIERYGYLTKYRFVVYLIACLSGMIASIPLCFNNNIEVIEVFRYFGLPLVRIVMLFLVVFALMFLYSTNRIIDDYSFTYGRPPEKYWIMFWRTAPLITLIALIFTLYKMKMDEFSFVKYYLVIVAYIQACTTLLPILLTFVIKCCMHVKYKTLASLTKPGIEWGPHNLTKRHARNYFYPQRDVKYRNTVLKCTHKCIAKSGYYQDEMRIQKVSLKNAIQHFEKENVFEFSDLEIK